MDSVEICNLWDKYTEMNLKAILFYCCCISLVVSCKSTKDKSLAKVAAEDIVVIANDSLEYEIIIIDQGFQTYLNSIAKPKWYYSKAYYQAKNKFYVTEWNIRVRNPQRYSPNIYEQQIDYDFNVDYGLEVDFKLYNYFKFVEYKYKVKPF